MKPLKCPSPVTVAAAHIAAKHGHVHAASLLIQAGLKCTAAAKDGTTALQLAQRNSHAEVVQLMQSLAEAETSRKRLSQLSDDEISDAVSVSKGVTTLGGEAA